MIADLHWGALFQIIVIDILLGGDNAVIIALACRNLPPAQRLYGVLWGTAGAIGLRVVLVAFAVALLDIPLLKLTGGLLLLWIGIKLLVSDASQRAPIKPADRLWSAIKTIIIADAVMSLDNVIAIAGAAEAAVAEHRLLLVVFGLLFSIPLIIWGSQLVLKLLDRFPFAVSLGAALLGWIAGGLIIQEPILIRMLAPDEALDGAAAPYIAGTAGALAVITVGHILRRRALRAKTG